MIFFNVKNKSYGATSKGFKGKERSVNNEKYRE